MRELTFCLTSALLFLAFGCADVQRVCPTGPESPYMAMAAEYWSSQGYPTEIATSSDCTIRTRVSRDPIPGDKWGKEDAVHKVYHVGVELEPSHLVQTEIRIKEWRWESFSHLERVYVTAHELGHAWHRDSEHYDWMPMLAVVPSETTIAQWLKDTGHESFIEP